MAGFRNTEYRNEWFTKVPGTDLDYADGSYFEEGGAYAVYDGAQNWMGIINKDGSFSGDGALTEYRASFLCAAKTELVRLGLVDTISEEKI